MIQTILQQGLLAEGCAFSTVSGFLKRRPFAIIGPLSLTIALTLLGPHAYAFTIRENLGGPMYDEAVRIDELNAQGQMSRIDGVCASACTLHLSRGPLVCVTDRAVLKFHEARWLKSNKRAVGETNTMFLFYPLTVQRWLEKRGGLTSKIITMNAKQAIELGLTKCPPIAN